MAWIALVILSFFEIRLSLDLTATESRKSPPLRPFKAQLSLLDFGDMLRPATVLSMPRRHELTALLDIGEADRKALQSAYEIQPSSYEELAAL